MSLISEFLGTEDWELNNSPMYRELKEELNTMNLLDKKREITHLTDADKRIMEAMGISIPPQEEPTLKDELIAIMLESYERWENTYEDNLQHLQNKFRKAAEKGRSEYKVSLLLVRNNWIKPEFVKAYFESMGLSVDMSNSNRIVFGWLN